MKVNISIAIIQSQETTVGGNDLYILYFTLLINSPPTHQPTYSCLISGNAYVLVKI
jgi:hypothetical protein